MSEAGGSGTEELNRYPPPSSALLWIVNVRDRKPRYRKKSLLNKQSCQDSSVSFFEKVNKKHLKIVNVNY